MYAQYHLALTSHCGSVSSSAQHVRHILMVCPSVTLAVKNDVKTNLAVGLLNLKQVSSWQLSNL